MRAFITVSTPYGIETYRAVLIGPKGIVAATTRLSLESAKYWLTQALARHSH